jgi:hypothetical protein
MRRLPLVIVSVALAALSLAPAVSAASTPFAGVWVAIDTDGSSQMLIVSGGSAPTVTYLDSNASVCANDGSGPTHFTANGRGSLVVEPDGTVDGLLVQFANGGCGAGRSEFPAFYFFEAGSLTDNFGNNWQSLSNR